MDHPVSTGKEEDVVVRLLPIESWYYSVTRNGMVYTLDDELTEIDSVGLELDAPILDAQLAIIDGDSRICCLVEEQGGYVYDFGTGAGQFLIDGEFDRMVVSTTGYIVVVTESGEMTLYNGDDEQKLVKIDSPSMVTVFEDVMAYVADETLYVYAATSGKTYQVFKLCTKPMFIGLNDQMVYVVANESTCLVHHFDSTTEKLMKTVDETPIVSVAHEGRNIYLCTKNSVEHWWIPDDKDSSVAKRINVIPFDLPNPTELSLFFGEDGIRMAVINDGNTRKVSVPVSSYDDDADSVDSMTIGIDDLADSECRMLVEGSTA